MEDFPSEVEGCPPEDALLHLVGNGAAPAAAGVARHLDRCSDCRRVVGVLAQTLPHPGEAAGRSDATPAFSRESRSLSFDEEELFGGVGWGAPAWMPPERVGEFQLGAPLGSGGMSIVFAAHDTKLDREVALTCRAGKERPEFLLPANRTPAAQERLLIEARATARLQHKNVAVVHAVGQIGGQTYIVQERLKGETLREIAKPLSGEEVLRIGKELAAGLTAAHKCGILHRDITSSNVMLLTDGTVKLLDFGLAKILDDSTLEAGRAEETPDSDGRVASQYTVTRTGTLIGTPGYMAPELWKPESARANEQTDIYAVGCVLYELCAGKLPYQAATTAELARRVCSEDAPPLKALAPTADSGLVAIITRCLHRDPRGRYSSAVELAAALEQLSRVPRRRLPARTALAGAAILTALAVVGVRQLGSGKTKTTAASASAGLSQADKNPPLPPSAPAQPKAEVAAAPPTAPAPPTPQRTLLHRSRTEKMTRLLQGPSPKPAATVKRGDRTERDIPSPTDADNAY